jgi:hypothetical protein
MQQFATAKNTTANAKLVFNKKLQLFKLIVAFNVTQRNKKGDLMFPQQSKCDYVSGDILLEDLQRTLQQAQATLRTSNIVFEG